jgi:hypothetical protein
VRSHSRVAYTSDARLCARQVAGRGTSRPVLATPGMQGAHPSAALRNRDDLSCWKHPLVAPAAAGQFSPIPKSMRCPHPQGAMRCSPLGPISSSASSAHSSRSSSLGSGRFAFDCGFLPLGAGTPRRSRVSVCRCAHGLGAGGFSWSGNGLEGDGATNRWCY